jgi:hypothetical protein
VIQSDPSLKGRVEEDEMVMRQEMLMSAPKHIVAHLQRPWLSGEEVESVRPLFKVDGSWAKALEEKEISAFLE